MTPQIIAHRGASYLAPENTLTAFKKAMEIGADGVEMDVQQTIDAGLVIHHDYMIDLHTDISGKIYDMTMGDLKELDFGSWKDAIFQDEKIATLQEAMELCRQMPGCTVHLELKSTMDNDPEKKPVFFLQFIQRRCCGNGRSEICMHNWCYGNRNSHSGNQCNFNNFVSQSFTKQLPYSLLYSNTFQWRLNRQPVQIKYLPQQTLKESKE